MAARSVDLVARLIADSSKFKQGIAEATLSAKQGDQMLRSMGRNMEQLGGKMTRGITLPFAAVGAAAVKTFTDFDTELNKIGTLVLGSTDGIDKLGESIRGVAVATGKGPDELAKAMFSIQSNGLRGAEAMDALTASAQASAAGLGDTQAIAKTAASAFMAYESTGLKASEAVDVLTATVREGNLSAEELAGSIGQVLPVASSASVELSEVGAAVALLTRNGAGASEAVTQVRSAITQLNAPTAEAADLMAKAGISTEKMRSVLADQGLVAAFELLNKKFGDTPEQLRKVLGSSEALNAVLSITSMDAQEVDRVFQATADSAGVTQKAFDQVSQTAGFKFQQAIAQVKDALIDLGDTLAPFAEGVASGIGKAADAISSLPAPVKNTALAFGGLLAAAGPVLSIGGKLVTNFGTMRSGLQGIITGTTAARTVVDQYGNSVTVAGASVGKFTRVLGGLGIAITAALALKELDQATSGLKLNMDDLSGATTDVLVADFMKLREVVSKSGAAAKATGGDLKVFRDIAEGSSGTAKRLVAGLEAQGVATEEYRAILAEVRAAEKQRQADMEASTAATSSLTAEQIESVKAFSTWTDGATKAAGAANEHAAAVEKERIGLVALGDELRAQFDPLFGMLDALQSNKEAQDAYNQAVAEHGAKSAEAQSALSATAKSALDVTSAQIALKKAVNDGTVSIDQAKQQVNEWEKQGLLPAGAAAGFMKGEIDKATFAANALDATSVHVPIDSDASQAQAEMVAFMAYTVALQATASANGSSIGYNLGAGIASGIAAAQIIATAQAAATVAAVIGAAVAAAENRSPSKRAAREVGVPITQGIGKGMLDATPEAEADAKEAARRLIDAALSELSKAQGAVDAAWDKIFGRMARQDAQQAVREAERALAQAGSGVDAAKREGARSVASERRDVARARRVLGGIDKSFNPGAWRDAQRTLNREQNEVARARNEAARATRQARAEARRERRDARQNLEDANLALLQESEWMVGSGQGGRFRNIAKAAGLRQPEINALVESLRKRERAEDRVSDARSAKVEIDYDKLAKAMSKAKFEIDVDQLTGKQRGRERASR